MINTARPNSGVLPFRALLKKSRFPPYQCHRHQQFIYFLSWFEAEFELSMVVFKIYLEKKTLTVMKNT